MAVVAPSFQDYLDLGQAEAQVRRPDLAFNDGDITEAQLHGSAAMADKVTEVAVRLARDTYFDGASGDALTALVDDHCNIQRKAGTKATTIVHLQRPGPGTPSGTIPAGTRIGAVAGPDGSQVVFTLDADLPVASGAGVGTPLNASVTAVDAGPESNIPGSYITKILDPIFDQTFTVTADTAAGGNLEESDEELRKRAKLYFLTLRRGTLLALEYGAQLITSVHVAHAIEDPATAAVTVVVSDSDGGSTLQMESDVQAELENWRCAGTLVQVVGGKKSLVDMTVQVVVTSDGFDIDTVRTAIAAQVAAKISARKGGEAIYLDALVAAAIATAPDDIFDIAFPAIAIDGTPFYGAGNVVPASNNVTFRPGTITVLGPDGT